MASKTRKLKENLDLERKKIPNETQVYTPIRVNLARPVGVTFVDSLDDLTTTGTGCDVDKIHPGPKENLEQMGFKLKTSYREAVRTAAESNGMLTSEFIRRAVFAALKNPDVLTMADEVESKYSSNFGPSRHYNSNH